MLESEAETKWCPMARLTAVASDGAFMWCSNRDNNPDRARLFCLGPKCACWVDTGYDMDAGERTGRCALARNG